MATLKTRIEKLEGNLTPDSENNFEVLFMQPDETEQQTLNRYGMTGEHDYRFFVRFVSAKR